MTITLDTSAVAAVVFGDCFSYALAKISDAALLFKGNDFAQTDILQVS